MTALRDVLVVSDLDGTLLDHHTYSWEAAAPALDVLRDAGASVVLASSKTAAELGPIREEIGFPNCPSIVENGSGLLEPGEAFSVGDDTVYRALRKAMAQLPQGFLGFGDMTTQEVSDRTGLSLDAARRARTRMFSEPGLWTGTPDALNAFLAAAAAADLTVQRGGRFTTLSFGGTKAERVQELVRRLKPNHTVVLGDAPNDVQMLALADSGVIVTNPSSASLPRLPGEDTGRIRRTQRHGPQGWADAVLDIVQELQDKGSKRANG